MTHDSNDERMTRRARGTTPTASYDGGTNSSTDGTDGRESY